MTLLRSVLIGKRVWRLVVSQCKYKSTGYAFLDNAKSYISKNENKIFMVDKHASFQHSQILRLSRALSEQVKRESGGSLAGQKVGVYCSNSYSYLISILAIWMARGVPFCLSKLYPPKYIEYFLDDSHCKLIINSQETRSDSTHSEFDRMLERKQIANLKLVESEYYKDSLVSNTTSVTYSEFVDSLVVDEKEKEAFLLYTSGTSGPPKGVKITVENLLSAIEIVVDAYKWSNDDKILNPLPLHHYSGLVYCLLTPFLLGAHVNQMPRFSAKQVWSELLSKDQSNVNVFVAVPTIYSQLIQHYESDLKSQWPRDELQSRLRSKMRLFGSGSGPLNVKTYNDWNELTNISIVERYGMTEIGMVLSNPCDESNEVKRRGGYVGRPYGRCKVRIVDLISNQVLVESDAQRDTVLGKPDQEIYGELQISGPSVFKEYHKRPEHTAASFTDDGWFKTGDTAIFDKSSNGGGEYKIVGRTSVDVIKTGGYKMSALDIERVILSNELIEDAAVMGLSDTTWGQIVFALIVVKPGRTFNQQEFLAWCQSNLPKYQVPRLVRVIDKMPRNLMFKVNKKELVAIYEQERAQNKL